MISAGTTLISYACVADAGVVALCRAYCDSVPVGVGVPAVTTSVHEPSNFTDSGLFRVYRDVIVVVVAGVVVGAVPVGVVTTSAHLLLDFTFFGLCRAYRDVITGVVVVVVGVVVGVVVIVVGLVVTVGVVTIRPAQTKKGKI